MKNSLVALNHLLVNLENAGIKTRNFHLIEGDIESSGLIPNIGLIRNDKFEVNYNVHTKKIIFSTTYSNQPITEDFIDQITEIHEYIPLLEQAMNIIIQSKVA